MKNDRVADSERMIGVPSVLELYAGIGGLSAAWPEAKVMAAVDIDRDAKRVYQKNFSAPYHTRELESVSHAMLSKFNADIWWMSPPCLPFTRRGQHRDDQDVRARSFLRLVEVAAEIQPRSIVIENVPGFETSRTWERLYDKWQSVGYRMQWRMLCPTELGWPNRRRRVYLIASLDTLHDWRPVPKYNVDLSQLIAQVGSTGTDASSELFLPESVSLEKGSQLSRVDLSRTGQIAACFASSYGRMLLGSGSYVSDGNRLRRFSPREVALLLGFPANFKLDEELSCRTLWRLLGNSLSLVAVRYILSHLPLGPDVFLPNFIDSSTVLDIGNDFSHR